MLFATSSFWQGVDVRGEQLSCVIVYRLPFAVPSDPVVAARVKALQEDGRNAFAEYKVPEAVIALKQGFGRLIRSLTDRGVLMLLDSRIRTTRYGANPSSITVAPGQMRFIDIEMPPGSPTCSIQEANAEAGRAAVLAGSPAMQIR